MSSLADLTPAHKAEFYDAFNDHAIFCAESLKLRDEIGNIVPLKLRPNQLITHKKISGIRTKGRPVRLVVLKPRRITNTVAICAEMFHDIPFNTGRRGTIIADKYNPAAIEALGYLQQFSNNYVPLVRHGASLRIPPLMADIRAERGQVKEEVPGHKIVWSNNSFVNVLSAEEGKVGRGGGRQWLLLDEVAFYRNASDTLTSALNMVPYLPGTGVIAQSTANGLGGEFYDLCQKAMDPDNRSGWEFLFLSWLENPLWVTPFDNPEARAKFQARLDREETTLRSMHGASLEALNWRRMKVETECRGSVEIFHQEYPTTPLEAFLASGRPYYSTPHIARQPVRDGEVGELITIEEYPNNRLLFDPRERGGLTVFRPPTPGVFYCAGGDPSKGKDVSERKDNSNPDYSVLWIGEQYTGEQVALFRARVRPFEFGRITADLCRWYNYAFVCPEANDPSYIDAILQAEYPTLLIYDRKRMPGDMRSDSPDQLGYEVTTQTRQYLIGALGEELRGGGLTIRSKVAQGEFYTFVIKPDGKAEHMANAHDDTVIAAAHFIQARRAAPHRKASFSPEAAARSHKPQNYGPQTRKPKRPEYED
jgi:hypothetical protein